ncbi:DnaD domain-containing protein [Rummeliibacillus sp. JY-2-4R]
MAKYRQVHTTFWDDSFVLDLTPEEKYFYLYLMTNGKTTQCGIYELPYRVIEMHTGYNRETVLKLLKRFIDYGKIDYHETTKELMIHNWARYNFINSPKVKKCIEKELLEVKHIPFVDEYLTTLERFGYRIDTVSIPSKNANEPKEPKHSNTNGSIQYRYPMDSLYIDLGEEEEKEEEQEEEKEQEKQQEKESRSSLSNQIFELIESNNMAALNSYTSQEVEYMIKDTSEELTLEAFKIAIDQNERKLRYVKGIIRNWKNAKLKTLRDLEIYESSKRGEQNGTHKQNSPRDYGKESRIQEANARRAKLLRGESDSTN